MKEIKLNLEDYPQLSELVGNSDVILKINGTVIDDGEETGEVTIAITELIVEEAGEAKEEEAEESEMTSEEIADLMEEA